MAFVFECDGKLTSINPRSLVFNRTTEIVPYPASRVDAFPGIQLLKKFDPFSSGFVAVDEVAESIDSAFYELEIADDFCVTRVVEMTPEGDSPVTVVPDSLVC